MKADLQDFEKSIYPKYQEAASSIPVQKVDARIHYQKLKTDLNKQVDVLHVQTKVNTVIQEMQSKIDDMHEKHQAAIDKQNNDINDSIAEIKEIILNLKSLLRNSVDYLDVKYISRNEEFRSLPGQFHVVLPTFTPKVINKGQVNQSICSLSEQVITYPLLDEPRLLTDIRIHRDERYGEFSSVSCLSNSELWTCRNDNTMRLYNLQGELLRTIKTKSGNIPLGVSVTKNEDLVYTDPDDDSVNLVTNTQIITLIRLQGWKPRSVCRTSSGDLLVIMESSDGEPFIMESKINDEKLALTESNNGDKLGFVESKEFSEEELTNLPYLGSKDSDACSEHSEDNEKNIQIIRYSGSTKKQSIQWDYEGKPLFLSGFSLCENRNLDICVADKRAGALVVVSAAGELRFKYEGHPVGPFCPICVTTDSHGNILTIEIHMDDIHIVDQNGHFLGKFYPQTIPKSICVDFRDNLFVTGMLGKIKKIQYYK